jgi:CHAD domain-containing protein
LKQYCEPAQQAAVEALTAQVQAMRDQVEPLRREDPDAVHDMRVASRRVRAGLAEYAKLFDPAAREVFRGRAREITTALGVPREIDVSISILQGRRREFHGSARSALNHVLAKLRALREQESAAIVRTAGLVASPEFDADVARLMQGVASHRQCYRKSAVRGATRRYRDVVDAYLAWQDDRGEQQLHRVRIAFKKLRYACEIYQTAYGRKMEKFVRSLKDVQDWLGDWHDYWVVRGYVTQAAPTIPPKDAEGAAELQVVVERMMHTLLEKFTANAASFFAASRQGQIARFLCSLEHECAWPEESPTGQSPGGGSPPRRRIR